ncbi:hypothetical protein H072_9518 [Dactylellina haptotyla CBS 200.50]|uniref:Dienelactone hydrolase domain-containing protein n=1 Tax=Dactylellina haptotyla (strain CBS 200.50) TaxID=1284197 RepID=S8A1U3_DACHA|nr:hypothetical protein H072_9518 [Dactylellina haptotyla CBS 200.50]
MDKVCEACKTIPPIVDQTQYEEKGHYEDINGINCYVAAPNPTPTSGVLFIYDIFGYYKQTLQGADIIAITDPGNVVIMPDFFFGKPYPLEKFPAKTEEDKAAFGSFFSNEAAFPKTTETALKVLAGLKEKYPDVKKWGVFGLCWGGKAATLLALNGDHFAASGQAHPAMLSTKDIESLTTPHICLPSKDEDSTTAKEVGDILNARKDGSSSAIYDQNFHGWMGARADLRDSFEKSSFEKGYTEVVEFFKKTLTQRVDNSKL